MRISKSERAEYWLSRTGEKTRRCEGKRRARIRSAYTAELKEGRWKERRRVKSYSERAPKLDPTLSAFVAAWSANMKSILCFSAFLFCESMHVCLAAWYLRTIS
jgi:hypothetical protein